ncbi:18002_t:CDS:2, partial [Entrophospora sp. SA101]
LKIYKKCFCGEKKTEETKVTVNTNASTNTSQKSPNNLDLSELDIEGLGEEDLELPVGNDELTEADLVDPVLLGELQALVSAIDALTKDVADDDIELTEEDMNDPKLLNELQALGYDNNGDTDKNDK